MQYMKKRDVALMLKCSERTLDKWKAERGLPAIKIGQVVRYEREAVLTWFASQQKGNERNGV